MLSYFVPIFYTCIAGDVTEPEPQIGTISYVLQFLKSSARGALISRQQNNTFVCIHRTLNSDGTCYDSMISS